MGTEVLRIWPEAPVSEVDPAGAWVRFDPPRGVAVYLERRAERAATEFVVVWCGEHGDGPVAQNGYGSFDQAVEAVRAFCACEDLCVVVLE